MKNNLCTISPHLPFADTLAGWVLDNWGHEPLLLSRALILLPSRRAASGLREAFLRAGAGRPLLLPRIEPLGDADEDALIASPFASLLPYAMPEDTFAFRRLFLLARLVQRQRGYRVDRTLALAARLAELLDECEREEVSLDQMMHIVPDAFAVHWQETVEFLKILSQHWPKITEEEKLISPGHYRGMVLGALAQHWQESPPQTPVIAAGTTASIPSTAALLAAISGLPQGFIVLPGLDMQADEAYFEHLKENHPQWGMAQLLKKLGRERADVRVIGEEANARVKLMSEVMRPAEVSDAWRNVKPDVEALQGIRYIPCASVQEEAGVIALMLREALETEGKTAALVTHNRGLARRVAAIMQRFGVTIDDSAGLALKETPLAAFLRLILEAAENALAPLPLLSLLKHPLATAGMDRIECLEAARELEVLALRGLNLGNGLQGMRQKLLHRNTPPRVHALLDHVEHAFAPLLALREAPLSEFLQAHIACAEALGSPAMWDGPEGDAITQFLEEMRATCRVDDMSIDAESYPAIFEELLEGRVLRPQYGMHPRLKILSPMEARMQSFDRMILSGLNEGSWPPQPQSDPWFSRPMRAELGLPAHERRAGLAAHDFFVLASGAEVILTRAGKEDGVPAQASRWLVKLLMLARQLPGVEEGWAGWAAMLDAPQNVTPAQSPAPKPPLAARPRTISVTQVETWLRDPYAFYARQILQLRKLKDISREPDTSDFGNAVHKALERFVKLYPDKLPAHALSELLRLGREAFAELFVASSLEVLWWPRFARIAGWIIAEEEKRRPVLTRVASEVESARRFGDVLLTGRADRIEERTDGGIAIIDYKTGVVPTERDIESGLASQLVLLALMARESNSRTRMDTVEEKSACKAGVIDDLAGEISRSGIGGGAPPIYLEYWKLLGGDDAGEIKSLKEAKIENYIEAAREGLLRLIARNNDPDFPYRSIPIPSRANRYSDYDHLARVKEWG